jgi:hypothetical protein
MGFCTIMGVPVQAHAAASLTLLHADVVVLQMDGNKEVGPCSTGLHAWGHLGYQARARWQASALNRECGCNLSD